MADGATKAWAASRIDAARNERPDLVAEDEWGFGYRIGPDTRVNPDTLSQLVEWRLTDPRYMDRQTRMKGLGQMPQRQWTIEARANFTDQGKNDAITEAIRTAAVHVHAVMVLLSDGQKPQVVAFSDDFFAGHDEISLIEDSLGKAKADHADMAETEISEDMLSALREMPKDPANK